MKTKAEINSGEFLVELNFLFGGENEQGTQVTLKLKESKAKVPEARNQ